MWPFKKKPKETFIKFFLVEDEISLEFCHNDDIVGFALLAQAICSGSLEEKSYKAIIDSLIKGGFNYEAELISTLSKSGPKIRPTQYP